MDGAALPEGLVDGGGSLPRRVWWAEVPRGERVAAYVAVDRAGAEVGRRQGDESSSSGSGRSTPVARATRLEGKESIRTSSARTLPL